jgi:CDP-glucose 4,6-dehydratase
MPVDPAFWRERRVLVTGHTGFKGRWLTTWLDAMGASVTGFSRAEGDLRDGESVARAFASHEPDVVFHLGGQPIVARSLREPAATFATNVLGTTHVLDAAHRTGGVRAIVVVSSQNCYEPGSEHPYREDDPLGGRDPYSSSQACAELVVSAMRRSFDLPVASARSGNVIGGGDQGEGRLLPELMHGALDGVPVAIGNPDGVRPWQHVLSPLSGYLLLAQALHDDASFATAFNFAPEPEHVFTVREVVERLGELWGSPLATLPDAVRPPNEAGSIRLDPSRARERLGWRPRWELEDGLRAVVDYYRGIERGASPRDLMLAQIAEYAEVPTLSAR